MSSPTDDITNIPQSLRSSTSTAFLNNKFVDGSFVTSIVHTDSRTSSVSKIKNILEFQQHNIQQQQQDSNNVALQQPFHQQDPTPTSKSNSSQGILDILSRLKNNSNNNTPPESPSGSTTTSTSVTASTTNTNKPLGNAAAKAKAIHAINEYTLTSRSCFRASEKTAVVEEFDHHVGRKIVGSITIGNENEPSLHRELALLKKAQLEEEGEQGEKEEEVKEENNQKDGDEKKKEDDKEEKKENTDKKKKRDLSTIIQEYKEKMKQQDGEEDISLPSSSIAALAIRQYQEACVENDSAENFIDGVALLCNVSGSSSNTIDGENDCLRRHRRVQVYNQQYQLPTSTTLTPPPTASSASSASSATKHQHQQPSTSSSTIPVAAIHHQQEQQQPQQPQQSSTTDTSSSSSSPMITTSTKTFLGEKSLISATALPTEMIDTQFLASTSTSTSNPLLDRLIDLSTGILLVGSSCVVVSGVVEDEKTKDRTVRVILYRFYDQDNNNKNNKTTTKSITLYEKRQRPEDPILPVTLSSQQNGVLMITHGKFLRIYNWMNTCNTQQRAEEYFDTLLINNAVSSSSSYSDYELSPASIRKILLSTEFILEDSDHDDDDNNNNKTSSNNNNNKNASIINNLHIIGSSTVTPANLSGTLASYTAKPSPTCLVLTNTGHLLKISFSTKNGNNNKIFIDTFIDCNVDRPIQLVSTADSFTVLGERELRVFDFATWKSAGRIGVSTNVLASASATTQRKKSKKERKLEKFRARQLKKEQQQQQQSKYEAQYVNGRRVVTADTSDDDDDDLDPTKMIDKVVNKSRREEEEEENNKKNTTSGMLTQDRSNSFTVTASSFTVTTGGDQNNKQGSINNAASTTSNNNSPGTVSNNNNARGGSGKTSTGVKLPDGMYRERTCKDSSSEDEDDLDYQDEHDVDSEDENNNNNNGQMSSMMMTATNSNNNHNQHHLTESDLLQDQGGFNRNESGISGSVAFSRATTDAPLNSNMYYTSRNSPVGGRSMSGSMKNTNQHHQQNSRQSYCSSHHSYRATPGRKQFIACVAVSSGVCTFNNANDRRWVPFSNPVTTKGRDNDTLRLLEPVPLSIARNFAASSAFTSAQQLPPYNQTIFSNMVKKIQYPILQTQASIIGSETFSASHSYAPSSPFQQHQHQQQGLGEGTSGQQMMNETMKSTQLYGSQVANAHHQQQQYGGISSTSTTTTTTLGTSYTLNFATLGGDGVLFGTFHNLPNLQDVTIRWFSRVRNIGCHCNFELRREKRVAIASSYTIFVLNVDDPSSLDEPHCNAHAQVNIDSMCAVPDYNPSGLAIAIGSQIAIIDMDRKTTIKLIDTDGPTKLIRAGRYICALLFDLETQQQQNSSSSNNNYFAGGAYANLPKAEDDDSSASSSNKFLAHVFDARFSAQRDNATGGISTAPPPSCLMGTIAAAATIPTGTTNSSPSTSSSTSITPVDPALVTAIRNYNLNNKNYLHAGTNGSEQQQNNNNNTISPPSASSPTGLFSNTFTVSTGVAAAATTTTNNNNNINHAGNWILLSSVEYRFFTTRNQGTELRAVDASRRTATPLPLPGSLVSVTCMFSEPLTGIRIFGGLRRQGRNNKNEKNEQDSSSSSSTSFEAAYAIVKDTHELIHEESLSGDLIDVVSIFLFVNLESQIAQPVHIIQAVDSRGRSVFLNTQLNVRSSSSSSKSSAATKQTFNLAAREFVPSLHAREFIPSSQTSTPLIQSPTTAGNSATGYPQTSSNTTTTAIGTAVAAQQQQQQQEAAPITTATATEDPATASSAPATTTNNNTNQAEEESTKKETTTDAEQQQSSTTTTTVPLPSNNNHHHLDSPVSPMPREATASEEEKKGINPASSTAAAAVVVPKQQETSVAAASSSTPSATTTTKTSNIKDVANTLSAGLTSLLSSSSSSDEVDDIDMLNALRVCQQNIEKLLAAKSSNAGKQEQDKEEDQKELLRKIRALASSLLDDK